MSDTTDNTQDNAAAAATHQAARVVPAAQLVFELRTADDASRLLARIFPADGWLEIKDHGVIYRFDIQSLLLGKTRTNTDEMRVTRERLGKSI